MLAYNPSEEKPEPKPRTFMFTPHPDGCACARCNLDPIQCPVYEGGVRCEKVCRGRRALGSHVIFIHKRRKRKMAAVLTPDGLGFLKKVLADPKRIYGLDLSALPRFAQSLAQVGMLRTRPTRRNRAATRYLYERAQANLDTFVEFPAFPSPGKLVEPITQLARLADVPPWVVVNALLAYGLEKLAHELRTSRGAPDPYIPAAQQHAAANAAQTPQPQSEPSRPTLLPTG